MALCVGIIAGTVAYTGLRYRELPERVPLHFGFSGRVDGTGPRPAVWLIVALQIFIGVTYAFTYLSGGSQRMMLVGCWIVAFMGWLQIQIVSVAISGSNRLPAIALWGGLAVCLLGVFAIVSLVR
ncbi:MAG TPA: DUF1648 domain-containing protein [Candidatus Tumulicola sp.]